MFSDPPYLDELLGAGVLIGTGVDGLYGRSGEFERIVGALDDLALREGMTEHTEVMRFPPGLSRRHFERSGYLKGHPQFVGTVHCFCGDSRGHQEILRCIDAGEDWTSQQTPSDVVLTPAACYAVYPTIARRGRLPADGALVDVMSYCFRHEPSQEPTRLLMFRQHEYVRIGTAEQVIAFRDEWLRRCPAMLDRLGLPCHADIANDPFFGRSGKILAHSQRSHQLKFELSVPINSIEAPTACVSFNYHLDHFGQIWDIEDAEGNVAHTACIGFGLERLALALYRHHGLQVADWPADLRRELWP